MNINQVEITYRNNTKKYQILRIEDYRCYVEKVIFPQESITFKAFIDATAIYTGDFISEKILIANLYEKKDIKHENY